jgi:hypothetical protein
MARRKSTPSSEKPTEYYEPIETEFVDEPRPKAIVVSKRKTMRPALTPEARENQLISLAVDLAEQQLREGTASSQVITHYLKLGSMREKLERERLQEEIRLQKAKTKALANAEEIKVLYENALKAMRNYGGYGETDEEY